MNTEHKVYKFVDDKKDELIQVEDLNLLVNKKLLQITGKPINIEQIFVKVKSNTGMLIGWSPLQTLELDEDGFFIAGNNRIGFVTAKGEVIRIKEVVNKTIMFNDKETTEEIDTLFNRIIGEEKKDISKENTLIQKLREKGYDTVKGGLYTLMTKNNSEPYLFFEANNELTLLDMKEIYNNEDSVKYIIENQGKELVFNKKSKKITVS